MIFGTYLIIILQCHVHLSPVVARFSVHRFLEGGGGGGNNIGNFGNLWFCIGCNFGAKCPFLIVLGLFESLDIDLYNGTGPIKKYSLSSEIQLLKVGHISKKSGKSKILRQPYKEILCGHWPKVFKRVFDSKKTEAQFFPSYSRPSEVVGTSYLVAG